MSTPPPRPAPSTIVVIGGPPLTMKIALETHLRCVESAINTMNGEACACGQVRYPSFTVDDGIVL